MPEYEVSQCAWHFYEQLWILQTDLHYKRSKEGSGLQRMVDIFLKDASSSQGLNFEAHSGILHVQALSLDII